MFSQVVGLLRGSEDLDTAELGHELKASLDAGGPGVLTFSACEIVRSHCG